MFGDLASTTVSALGALTAPATSIVTTFLLPAFLLVGISLGGIFVAALRGKSMSSAKTALGAKKGGGRRRRR